MKLLLRFNRFIRNERDLQRLLIYSTITLFAIGIIFLTYSEAGLTADFISTSITTQILIGVFSGGFFLFLFPKIKKSWLNVFFLIVVIVSFILLSLLLTNLGVEVNNAVRWVSLLGVTIQPSEFFKIGAIIFLAYIFSEYKKKNTTFKTRELIISFSIFSLLVLFFAYTQPDYGFLLVTLITTIAMIYVTSIDKKIFFSCIGILGVLGSILIFFVDYIAVRFSVLKKYYFDELTVSEMRGEGYQLIKGIESVKDGGIFGQDLESSVQSIATLPEVETDLIFALIAQKSGFIVTAIILFIFMAFIYSCFKLTFNIKNRLHYLICVGIASLFTVEIFLNIFVVLGLFINTGVPLLFFSKGGSSLMATLLGVGIILALSMNKPTNINDR